MRRHRAARRPPSALTRRELLLGGAGVCVALAAGAVVERGRIVGEVKRLLTRSEHGLVQPHSKTTVVYRTFHSSVLGKEVAYGIAWPAGASVGEPLPVCFCLPGRGGGPQAVLGLQLSLADYLSEAVKNTGRPFALAAIDGG